MKPAMVSKYIRVGKHQGANAVKEPLVTEVESSDRKLNEPEILGDTELMVMVP